MKRYVRDACEAVESMHALKTYNERIEGLDRLGFLRDPKDPGRVRVGKGLVESLRIDLRERLNWCPQCDGPCRNGGTSLGDLATAVGVSKSTLSRWLSGKASPSAAVIDRVYAFLRASLESKA